MRGQLAQSRRIEDLVKPGMTPQAGEVRPIPRGDHKGISNLDGMQKMSDPLIQFTGRRCYDRGVRRSNILASRPGQYLCVKGLRVLLLSPVGQDHGLSGNRSE